MWGGLSKRLKTLAEEITSPQYDEESSESEEERVSQEYGTTARRVLVPTSSNSHRPPNASSSPELSIAPRFPIAQVALDPCEDPQRRLQADLDAQRSPVPAASSGSPPPISIAPTKTATPSASKGVLPFCGFVPDFTTTTVWFRQLSQIYETKHHEDVCRITELTLSLVQTYVLPLLPQTQHDVAETLRAWVHGLARDLVKNIWSVCLVQLLPLPGTEDPVAWRRHQAQRARRALRSLSDPTDRCSARSAYLSVGLVALHQLPPRERCGHDDCSLPVARDLFSAVEALLSDSVPEEDEEPEASGAWWEPHRHGLHQCCHEILRFGSTELASVAATVGALAAQECIKLIQRQRVPAHQLILYNGLDNQFFLME